MESYPVINRLVGETIITYRCVHSPYGNMSSTYDGFHTFQTVLKHPYSQKREVIIEKKKFHRIIGPGYWIIPKYETFTTYSNKSNTYKSFISTSGKESIFNPYSTITR